ncbi:MAG: ATP-binding protein [Bacteroidales bacterium]
MKKDNKSEAAILRQKAEQELIIANKELHSQNECKKAKQALLRSEKNFRCSISESPLGIRIVSVDGEIIYANKAFLDIYGFNSLEEFESIPAINLHTPESYAKHQERKEKRKNGHEVFDYEISIICKNAEIRHVKVWRKEVLWNGIKHYQVINLNITEQKKLIIDMIAAKEHAEESDRLKSAFLANVSHEIRTPMNGILGFAEILKEPKLTGEEQQEYISIIEKSAARMLNIINDIVDISKIESGLMKVNATESNVNEQIEYIYTFFKPEIEGKGMQFFFKNSLPLKEAILKTDHEKVYSILTNLVKNAIKFSDKGSIGLGYEKNGEYFEFFVKDTGIGIPKDRQKAIFDRFVQADIGDKRAFQGAGLGLSISKAYVEMLGGKIWVESEVSKGSIFYFTIPYNAELEEKNVIQNVILPEGADNQVKNLKILIAEDDELSAMLLKKVVQLYGKEIIKVGTGVEAVEACRNNPDIDLVLMDIKMPEMDGYEATRQIRQFNKDVVIIAQTAFALTGDQEKTIAAGCNDYISKPIKKDKLMELMQKYFKKQENKC